MRFSAWKIQLRLWLIDRLIDWLIGWLWWITCSFVVVGYLYIIFDNERSVRALLQSCTQDLSQNNRNYYFKVCSSRLRRKDVQVIPWQLADSTYVRNGCISAFGTKTVFVGSLHGMLNAEGLARIMDDLFGGVVAANVDTGKKKIVNSFFLFDSWFNNSV